MFDHSSLYAPGLSVPFRQLATLLAFPAACLLAVSAQAAEAGVPLTDALRQPGIQAEYFAPPPPSSKGAAKTALVVRQEAAPTLLLRAGETPDSRLPPTGWKVRWTGVIDVLQPGKYRFSAKSSGPLSVRIGDRAIIGHLPQIAGKSAA